MSEAELNLQNAIVQEAVVKEINKLKGWIPLWAPFILFLPLLVIILVPIIHLAFENLYFSESTIADHWLPKNVAHLMAGDHKGHIDGYIAFAALYTGLIAAFSLIVAFMGYRAVRRSQSCSKTLDFITQQIHDGDIIEMFNDFRLLRRRYKNQTIYYDEIHADYIREKRVEPEYQPKHDYNIIIQVLNYYETWEIGIENKALDDKMLRDWWRSSLVKDFIDLYAFVLGYRDANQAPKIFEKAEKLARRWAERDEPKDLDRRRAAYDERKRAAERSGKLSAAMFRIFRNRSETGAENQRRVA